MKKITKAEATRAKKLLDRYNKQTNAWLGRDSYTCICCKEKEVKLLMPHDGIRDLREQQQEMWRDGTVFKVFFGYGSKLDMDGFFMGLCDDCALELEEKRIVVNIGELIKRARKYDPK